jgi:hypothetical protein
MSASRVLLTNRDYGARPGHQDGEASLMRAKHLAILAS